MEVGIRFSSPLPEKSDLDKFNEILLNKVSNSTSSDISQIEEILKYAPYEISILACLCERMENKLKGNRIEL